MALAFDREKLLYAVGSLLGVAAVAYFGFRLFDQVSPFTTAALLVGGFVCFLVAGAASDTEPLDLVADALAAGAYLVFVAYVLWRFDVGDGGTFLLLAVSAGLFIALGSLTQQDRLAVSRRGATAVVVVVAIAAVALVVIDLAGAHPTETAAFEETVEIPEPREEVRVGTITVDNEFFLPREADVPRFHACVYGPAFQPAPLEYEPRARSELLRGGETRRSEILLPSPVFYTDNSTLREGFRDRESVPVERRSDCPSSVDEPKVVVVENEPRPPYLATATTRS
jgi:hypothetical protein